MPSCAEAILASSASPRSHASDRKMEWRSVLLIAVVHLQERRMVTIRRAEQNLAKRNVSMSSGKVKCTRASPISIFAGIPRSVRKE